MPGQPIVVNGDVSERLDKYLERIKYKGFAAERGVDISSLKSPSLQELDLIHQAHIQHVPFENLSIHFGEKMLIDFESVYHTLVERKRGGWCSQQNNLLAWALREKGYQVDILQASVWVEDHYTSPFDHMHLVVHFDKEMYLADVGMGSGHEEPLKFVLDAEQAQGQRAFRILRAEDSTTDQIPEVVKAEEEYVLQELVSPSLTGGKSTEPDKPTWTARYKFTLTPHQWEEFLGMAEYNQTSPHSVFTKGPVVTLPISKAEGGGRITLSGRNLKITKGGKKEVKELKTDEEYIAALKEHFDISVNDVVKFTEPDEQQVMDAVATIFW